MSFMSISSFKHQLYTFKQQNSPNFVPYGYNPSNEIPENIPNISDADSDDDDDLTLMEEMLLDQMASGRR